MAGKVGKPKGYRHKLTADGLKDLLPMCKSVLVDALQNGTRPEKLEAVKIVSKYTLIEGHKVTHSYTPITEEFVDGIFKRSFGNQASAVDTLPN